MRKDSLVPRRIVLGYDGVPGRATGVLASKEEPS